MRVTGNHRGKARGMGIEIQHVHIVDYKEQHAAQFHTCGLRQPPRPGSPVGVAPDGSDRSQSAKRGQNIRRTDISRVDDAVDPLERDQSLRPEESVRI